MDTKGRLKEDIKLELNELNDLIIESIQDIKGQNIVKLDLRKLEDKPADFFIICEGESTTQVSAIANNVVKRLKYEADNRPLHVEGKQFSQWVLVDYFNIVLHVFHPDSRAFYELEDLWCDAEFTTYENL